MLAKALATMKTFSKFDQTDLDLFTDEEEYTEYKSWYLTFYDEQKAKAKADVKNILADIEFNIIQYNSILSLSALTKSM